MALVWIPALLRDLTGGAEQAEAAGETVGEVIDHLEERFPGIRARLVEDGRLRPGITVVVDGVTGRRRLRQPVRPQSEVHFIPALSGG